MSAPRIFAVAAALAGATAALGALGCDTEAYCFEGCLEVGTTGTGAGGTGGATSSSGEVTIGSSSSSGAGGACGDTQSDPENCGECGNACALPNAVAACALGECVIDACVDGYYDVDDSAATGCEYACVVPEPLPESCDGLDNDCDGLLDGDDPDLDPPTGLCNATPGTPCEGTVVVCNGAGGWQCEYPMAVEVEQGFVLLDERRCDGLDGNCDGSVDEWFIELGDACTDGGLGQCADGGVIVCDMAQPSQLACDLSVLPDPAPPSPEACNGVDDDCDGLADNALAPSAFAMVPVPGGSGVTVDAYEASRPDATGVSPGIVEAVACSSPGALPWTGGSYSEAAAACAARGAGFRLCTAAELEDACRGPGDVLYPYGASYDPSACNGVELGVGAAVATGSVAACVTPGPDVVADLSGNVAEWTSTQTNAAAAPDRIFQLHGGSYLSPEIGLACTIELAPRADEGTLLGSIGFRCCRD